MGKVGGSGGRANHLAQQEAACERLLNVLPPAEHSAQLNEQFLF
jgi:hypothetical protein